MRILVIIPAYNEAQKIAEVVASVRDRGFEVLVVDDGSRDQTGTEAHKAGARVLRHVINRGYGAALSTGNAYAVRNGYDCAVHFDADGQHDPAQIPAVIAPIASRTADAVIGSRFLNPGSNVPAARALLIKVAIIFTWFFSGIRLTDAHNGFRAFSKDALSRIDCRQDGMAYASEVVDQIGEHRIQFTEVPITIRYSDYSRSKGEGNVKKILVGIRFLWSKITR